MDGSTLRPDEGAQAGPQIEAEAVPTQEAVPSFLRRAGAFLGSDYGTFVIVAILMSSAISVAVVAISNRFGLLGNTGAQKIVTVDLMRLVIPQKSQLNALMASRATPEMLTKVATSEAQLSVTVDAALREYSNTHHVVVIQKDAVFAGNAQAQDITNEIDATVAPQRAAIMGMIEKAAAEAPPENATPVTPRAADGATPPFPPFPLFPGNTARAGAQKLQ